MASLPITEQGNNSRKYHCPKCTSSFKRLEHLKRHQSNHEKDRRLSCAYCPKTFARSDVLARHAATHSQTNDLPEVMSDRSSKRRRKRACIECAKARERCTTGQPCRRCSVKSFSCTYPPGAGPNNIDRMRGKEWLIPGDSTGKLNNGSQSDDEHAPAMTSPRSGLGLRSDVTMGSEGSDIFTQDGINGDGAQPVQLSHGDHLAGPRPFIPSLNQDPRRNSILEETQTETSFQNDGYQDTIALGQGYSLSLGAGVDTSSSAFTDLVYPGDTYDPLLDFPINWLPVNDSISIDYNSFLGVGPELTQVGDVSISYLNQLPYQADPTRTTTATTSPMSDGLMPSPARTVSTTTRLSVKAPVSEKGPDGLYATSSNSARAPCTVRSTTFSSTIYAATRLQLIESTPEVLGTELISFTFPDVRHIKSSTQLPSGMPIVMRQETYGTICQQFRRLCLTNENANSTFQTPYFPALEHFNLFIHLYFEHFNPVFPIIHTALLDINGSYWPLAVAIAAIGCQYTQTKEFSECVSPMHEFLLRVVAEEIDAQSSYQLHIPKIQAIILCQIGMLYYGHTRHVEVAKTRHGVLVHLVERFGLLQQGVTQVGQQNGQDVEGRWRLYVEEEARRRLGYAIWMLDCMSAYHFSARPLLSLAVACPPLPHDKLWEATDCTEWATLYSSHQTNPSLASAVQTLFTEKQVKSDLGEFGRVILLHGVYSELFQVKAFYSRPLSTWVPAEQSKLPVIGASDGARSSSSSLSSWRNASLDCVDVLHWAAMGTIAQLCGSEHPTVLHLHMSRIVLLVPYDAIQTVALYIAYSGQAHPDTIRVPSKERAMEAELEIMTWCQRDEHKARLCMIHCGAVFWHLRRYSTMIFHEPMAVYLATLTIWAYGSYTSRAAQPSKHRPSSFRETLEAEGMGGREDDHAPSVDQISTGSATPVNDSQPLRRQAQGLVHPSPPSVMAKEPLPTFVQLDRPCDDEIVCTYVRVGHPSLMQACMSGVGDVCSPNSPAKVLREGRKLLNAISLAWGRNKTHVAVLAAMEKAITSGQSRQEWLHVGNS